MISRSYNFLCSAGSKSVRCRLGQLRGPRGVRGAVGGAEGGGAGGERQEVPGAQDAGHRAGQELELQTNLSEDYAKFYNHGVGAFSWLKATSAFTFKTLLRHYTKLALTHGK